MLRNFIKATDSYTTFEKNVPSYYIRKSFNLDFEPERCTLKICTPGFYLLFINGVDITKGFLAPYISNPDHFVCYDEYEISTHLTKGENVIGFMLGNGFANQTVNQWEFSKATFRAPLCASLELKAEGDNEIFELSADESFKCHPSPIIYDMYRYGTHYDARLEIDNWSSPCFDDSLWENVMMANCPKGEIVHCNAHPVIKQYELNPVDVKYKNNFCYLKTAYENGEDIEFTRVKDGYLYDFGKTVAGVCKIRIKGRKGQKITIRHCERLTSDGNFNLNSIYTFNEDYSDYIHLFQADVYILKGDEEEIFVPPFTYHGFRYVFVEGIDSEQASKELLTAVVFNSDIKQKAGFKCSDSVINKLYDMAILADNSNFHYFPTDCPQREKNGWTGDAAVSAQQYSLFFDCKKSFEQWFMSVRYSQIDGKIPGIIPTCTWGYEWGNGPAWDAVCVNIPYYSYKYNGNKQFLSDNAKLIYDYLKYISNRRDEKGLVEFGLGDWCQPGSGNINFDAPLVLTDTVTTYDNAIKASYIFDVLDKKYEKEYALNLASELKKSIRENFIDFKTMTALGASQTSQAFMLSVGLFEDDEYKRAYERLLDFIHEKDDHVVCGVIGLRHIFRVLCNGGDADLAIKIMCRPDAPSYGHMITRGATALCEALDENGVQESSNHHFYGDILTLFHSYIAGLRINPDNNDVNSIVVSPVFPEKLNFACASYESEKGRIDVEWKKDKDSKTVSIYVPDGIHGCFVYGDIKKPLKYGLNEIHI